MNYESSTILARPRHDIDSAATALASKLAASSLRSRGTKPSMVVQSHSLETPSTRDRVANCLHHTLQALRTEGVLACVDVAAVVLAGMAAASLVAVVAADRSYAPVDVIFPAVIGTLISFVLLGLYSTEVGLSPVVELRQTGVGLSLVFMFLLSVAPFLATDLFVIALQLGLFWLLSIALAPLARSAARSGLSRCAWWGHPTLVFSAGPGDEVFQALKSNPRSGLRPLGVVEIDERDSKDALVRARGRNAARQKCVVDWAVVSAPPDMQREALRFVDRCAAHIPNRLFIPETNDLPTLWTRMQDCGGTPGFAMKERLLLPAPTLFKRTMDIVATSLGSLLLLPFLLGIAAAIKLTSKGPVFYWQERIGRGGRVFHMLKFRSMVTNGDEVLEAHFKEHPAARLEWEVEHKLRDDPRVTPIGRFLRKSSLDELPQIWNVLLGDMSLVGPRPIVNNAEGIEYVVEHEAAFETYAKVRPGITGLWQVSGRNNTTFKRRVQCDTFYVWNWSPWLDIYILARTVIVVLRQEGAC